MSDYITAAARDILTRRQWPRAHLVSIDEFQEAVFEDIRSLLAQSSIACDEDEAAAIAGRLWTILRTQ